MKRRLGGGRGGQESDARIVARVLKGDREGFAELVRRHQAALYRHARGMGLDPDGAEDMVQEALVKAYSGLAECRDPDRFRAWIFRILRNGCLDHLKNVRRKNVSLEVADDGQEFFGAEAPTELRHELDDALDRLSPLLREAFLLKHEAGYSYDELAGIADSTASAMKMRVHRAREELRSLLAVGSTDVTIAQTRSSNN